MPRGCHQFDHAATATVIELPSRISRFLPRPPGRFLLVSLFHPLVSPFVRGGHPPEDKPLPLLRSWRSKSQTVALPSTVCIQLRGCHQRGDVNRASFPGISATYTHHAPSSCSQSPPSLPAWTCRARQTQIRYAHDSSPYFPTRLCSSVNLELDLLSTEDR
jgi:hypothetical protein